MQLESILGAGYLSPATVTSAYAKQEENSSSIPSSWQSDTVSISAEARAAAQRTGSVEDKKEEEDAATAFSDYMKKVRGEDGGASSGDPEEQIKALEEKIKKLSSQMEQVASETGLSESSKEAKMEAIHAEIGQLTAQIAELKGQMAKSGSA